MSTYTFGSRLWFVHRRPSPPLQLDFPRTAYTCTIPFPLCLLPSSSREREREIVPNELCVRTYVHRACISPPVSVLISHQFLLWRTRGPGRQQAILVAASRCLDLEDVASALYSSRGSRGSPPLVLSPDIFLYLVVFHFPSSFRRVMNSGNNCATVRRCSIERVIQ